MKCNYFWKIIEIEYFEKGIKKSECSDFLWYKFDDFFDWAELSEGWGKNRA
jgi:hypothetical protein